MNKSISCLICSSENVIGFAALVSTKIWTRSFSRDPFFARRVSRILSMRRFSSPPVEGGTNGRYLMKGNIESRAALFIYDMNIFFSRASSEVTRSKEPPNEVALMTSYGVNGFIIPGIPWIPTDVRLLSILDMSTTAEPRPLAHLESSTFSNT